MLNRSLYRLIVVIGILLSILFGAESTLTRTLKCEHQDANSGIWLATRLQYDTSYVAPQTLDANSGIWLATRLQYETSYVAPQTLDANSGIWLATRQQYDTSYAPSVIQYVCAT